MKYRLLGNSGLYVSRLTLGTMTFGADKWGCDEQEAHAIMWKYLDAGGNSISVIVGIRNQEQLSTNIEVGDWDVPTDVWNVLEEQTRPEEDYLNWFAKNLHSRFFSAVEFHNETTELP